MVGRGEEEKDSQAGQGRFTVTRPSTTQFLQQGAHLLDITIRSSAFKTGEKVMASANTDTTIEQLRRQIILQRRNTLEMQEASYWLGFATVFVGMAFGSLLTMYYGYYWTQQRIAMSVRNVPSPKEKLSGC